MSLVFWLVPEPQPRPRTHTPQRPPRHQIVYNWGLSRTTIINNRGASEYELLSKLPPHRQIVASLGRVRPAPLPAAMLSRMSKDMRDLATKVTGWGDNRKETPRKSLGVVFEYLPKNLEEHLTARGNDISADEVVSIAVQILRAAQHLHAHRVVHFDFKLDNFLVDPSTGALPATTPPTCARARSLALCASCFPLVSD